MDFGRENRYNRKQYKKREECIMTIQQLQYVLEIARCGSASRAAKNLFLSQPNLSSAIKNLEQELGFPIFERTSAGMKLTPAGARLAKEASVIMEHLKGISDSEKMREAPAGSV